MVCDVKIRLDILCQALFFFKNLTNKIKKYNINRKWWTNMNIIIRKERQEEYREVESITREAFWNVYRPGCVEHYILHCFRNDKAFVPQLDLVIELDGKLIGQIIYVRSEIQCEDGTALPIMTFGPISILPEYKRQGYGKMLLEYSIEKAKEIGVGALAITGNIDFYGKLGFTVGKSKEICYADDPKADYFLIKELKQNYLNGIKGTYRDPDGYFASDINKDDFEKYDATFPKKEKKKLPGQLM